MISRILARQLKRDIRSPAQNRSKHSRCDRRLFNREGRLSARVGGHRSGPGINSAPGFAEGLRPRSRSYVLGFEPGVLRIYNVAIEQVVLDEPLRRSDIVSLHLPLTTETRDRGVSALRTGAD